MPCARLIFCFPAVLAGLYPAFASAQTPDYPSRQIRLVVPYPPGGIADIPKVIKAAGIRAE